MKEVSRALSNAATDSSKLLLLSAVGRVFCSGLDHSYLVGRLSTDRRKESNRIADAIRWGSARHAPRRCTAYLRNSPKCSAMCRWGPGIFSSEVIVYSNGRIGFKNKQVKVVSLYFLYTIKLIYVYLNSACEEMWSVSKHLLDFSD